MGAAVIASASPSACVIARKPVATTGSDACSTMAQPISLWQSVPASDP